MIDKKLGIMESAKLSGELTEGIKWKMIWLFIVCYVISDVIMRLGVLCFFVVSAYDDICE